MQHVVGAAVDLSAEHRTVDVFIFFYNGPPFLPPRRPNHHRVTTRRTTSRITTVFFMSIQIQIQNQMYNYPPSFEGSTLHLFAFAPPPPGFGPVLEATSSRQLENILRRLLRRLSGKGPIVLSIVLVLLFFVHRPIVFVLLLSCLRF